MTSPYLLQTRAPDFLHRVLVFMVDLYRRGLGVVDDLAGKGVVMC